MKILLISYGDYEYDGRLRELMDVFSGIGELYAFTRGKTPAYEHHRIMDGGYQKFIRDVVKEGKALGGADLLVLDNRKSVIPGLILKKKLSVPKVVLDCRELYVPKEVHHLEGKLGCIIEKRGIRRADIIICANEYRAEAMKKIYGLSEKPLVYENLRMLTYSSEERMRKEKERFSKYDVPGEYRIISTSGCSFSRMNDVLVRNLDRVRFPCRLFLVGSGSAEERENMRALIAERGLDNVEIIDQLDQDALKSLIGISHIGIVNYHQKDQNNRFCASGKVFEFLYEGLPVVTTTNPPLKQLCDEAGVGAADDSFCDGINAVIEDYEGYKKRVREFAAAHTVASNNERLSRELREKLF